MESSDQDGKETQVSFKTFEGERGRQDQPSKGLHLAVSEPGLLTGGSNSLGSRSSCQKDSEKLCVLSKAQTPPGILKRTPNSQNQDVQAA